MNFVYYPSLFIHYFYWPTGYFMLFPTIFLFQEKKDAEKAPEEAKKPAEAKPKKPLSHVKDFEEDTVYLFQYTRSPQVNEEKEKKWTLR